jgi:hypothetical protein
MQVKAGTAIRPKNVRYIKLGRAGGWERECIEKGIIRFGFGTGNTSKLSLCVREGWDKLTKLFIEEGKDKGTATRFSKETVVTISPHPVTRGIENDYWENLGRRLESAERESRSL